MMCSPEGNVFFWGQARPFSAFPKYFSTFACVVVAFFPLPGSALIRESGAKPEQSPLL